MTEGWLNGDYIILFSEAEGAFATSRYQLSSYLPGYSLAGLRGWDDFLVFNSEGNLFSLPTVPIDPSRAKEFVLPKGLSFEPDDRFTGKIKWYVKPIVFGGSPQDAGNLIWVSHEQHAQLVIWWNEQFKTLKAQAGNA